MTNTRRHLAVCLAFAAIVLRAALPVGWMPQSGAHVLTLCTMSGPVQVALDDHGKPVKNTGKTSDICPFAAGMHVAVGPSAPPHPAMVALAALSRPAPRTQLQKARRFAPHAARAPPAFA